MPRPELPKELKKISINITVSREVVETAKASGNASKWFDEAGKNWVQKEKRKANKTNGDNHNEHCKKAI